MPERSTVLDETAWHIVAQYLPAQPVLYMRMATVNKQFYRVFMSDQVWARVDVYGIERQISSHFLAKIYLLSTRQLDFVRRMCDGKVDPVGDKELLRKFGDSSWDLYTKYAAIVGPQVDIIMQGRIWNKYSWPVHKMMAESGRVEYLGEKCKRNKELALAAVSFNGLKLAQLPESMKIDRDVVLAAVRNNGMALEFADTNLQGDDEVLHAAVFQNGMALKWAPKATEFGTTASAASDRIILTAIKNNFKAAKYLKSRAFRHPDCFNAIKRAGRALEQANNPACDPRRMWVVTEDDKPRKKQAVAK